MPCVAKGSSTEREAAIAAHLAFHKQLSFLRECLTQVIVELGKTIRIRRETRNLPQPEPLAGEIAHQGLGTRIGEELLQVVSDQFT